MSTVATLRRQIEANLAARIPSALTPAPRTIRPVAITGIRAVDELLEGGLPLGAITEVVGPECSGRTSFALSFLAQMTQTEKVCAWIDVSDALDPESAAAAGVDLSRLLWVRCGVQSSSHVRPPVQRTFSLPEKYLVPPPFKKGLHGGGFGPHPRNEVKGLSDAVSGLLKPEYTVRVELHKADSDDYDSLHEYMEEEGFSRYVINSNDNVNINYPRPNTTSKATARKAQS
jgi:hypothetical protein